MTDQLYIPTEPRYPLNEWYPNHTVGVNRFLSIEGEMKQLLVITPGQLKASADSLTPLTTTVGAQRLYSDLQLQVLTSTFSITDFTAPAVQAVDAFSSSTSLAFKAREVLDHVGG